jgi:hypothetical protein
MGRFDNNFRNTLRSRELIAKCSRFLGCLFSSQETLKEVVTYFMLAVVFSMIDVKNFPSWYSYSRTYIVECWPVDLL